MIGSVSRRQKGILITTLAGVIVCVAGLTALLYSESQTETYVPGERIAGVTSRLDRSVVEDVPAIVFKDVAEQAGIAFSHFPAMRTTRLPEDMGSGAAWGDFDGDGWQDLYLVNIAGPVTMADEEMLASSAHNVLYRNTGDGTFDDVSIDAGVGMRCWCSGAAWADYDNDGQPDLFVTAYGENGLYRNLGNGRFEDVSAAAGVGGLHGFWTGASWGDYDRDGWLDLYVTGYVRFVENLAGQSLLQYDVESPVGINPSSYAPERNLLYQNTGDGTFEEVAESAGVDNVAGRSLSASWADFNDDGWPDLYVANDVSDNVLYLNRSDGAFEDVSHSALVADYRGAMGLAVGDWDGDLDLDLFITHWIAQENALYSNRMREGSGSDAKAATGNAGDPVRFIDVADRFGLGQVALDYVGWGTFFFDYDNDGRLDLFVSNGSTLQRRDRPEMLIPMTDMLFWNGGPDRGFFETSGLSGDWFQTARVGRGAAYADYDNDGDLDIVVSNHGGRAVLLANSGHPTNHWLGVRLIGRRSNRDGIGARIRVVSGGAAAVREVGAQSSYLSQNSLVAHFGLGSQSRADSVVVRWPAGGESRLIGIDADQIVTIDESSYPQ